MTRIKDIFFIFLIFVPFSIYLLPSNHSSDNTRAVENEWDFYSDFDPGANINGDTIHANGNVYYGFGRSSDESECWFRSENGIVYTFNSSDNKEYILYDFTMEIGDSIFLPEEYTCSFDSKIFLLSKNDTTKIP
ncbi:MAG: hypothetical protein P8Y99_10270 [Calditrichaceae bacterium]